MDSDRLHQSTRCSVVGKRASYGTRRTRRRVEQGPHSWGCDRKGVHSPAERNRRARPATGSHLRQEAQALLRPPRARFESCQRDQHAPVAQWMREHAVTTREVEGSNPSGGATTIDAVTQRPECSPVEREAAGSNPASVATVITARNSTGRVPDS